MRHNVMAIYDVILYTSIDVTCQHLSINHNSDYFFSYIDRDFSILILNKEVDLNDNVGMACLPKDASSDYVGETVTVSGWGALYSNGPAPPKLQEVQQTVLANDKCGNYNQDKAGSITKYQLCAAAAGKDSCQGDSGGKYYKTIHSSHPALFTNSGYVAVLGFHDTFHIHDLLDSHRLQQRNCVNRGPQFYSLH